MEKTWKPTVAGILAIIAGALQVIFGMVECHFCPVNHIWDNCDSRRYLCLTKKDLGVGTCRIYLCTHWSLVYSWDTRHYIRRLGEG
jgi:hypothetical protein